MDTIDDIALQDNTSQVTCVLVLDGSGSMEEIYFRTKSRFENIRRGTKR